MPWPSRKNSRFSGEEQAETREVDLLLVHLHLREVRVVGQVGGQVLRQAVLDVHPAGALPGVPPRRRGRQVGGHAADGVRLDLEEVVAAGRHLQPDQRRRLRDAKDARPPRRDGQRRQKGQLVPAPDGAAELDAPDLRRPGPVAQRLERDLHLDGPPAVEASRPHVPHRVPVAVGIPLVGDGEVAQRAQRVGVEADAVAPIAERVEDHPETVVVAELGRVAPHLVGHPLGRRRRVPHARADVDALRVERDPGLRALRGGRALVGHELNEVGDGPHAAVQRLVEQPVEPQAGCQLDGADGHAALSVADDHLRRARPRRTADLQPRAGAARRRERAARQLARVRRAGRRVRRGGRRLARGRVACRPARSARDCRRAGEHDRQHGQRQAAAPRPPTGRPC